MSYVAQGTYFDSGVAKEDKTLITQYQDRWAAADAASRAAQASGNTAAYQAAEAAKAQAHAGAEAVRNYYGYSGGSDGTDYIPVQTQTAQSAQRQRTSAANEYRNLYSTQSDSAYRQQLAAQEAANKAAVQKAVNSLEGQKASTEQQYADLFRQLYVNKMKNRKNLSQQLAAGGITGGAAESTILGYDTAYEEALRQGEQGRINSLGSLDQAITDARLTGDITGAEAAAATAKEQMSAYADALKYLINRQDGLMAQQTAYDREDAAAERSYAYKTAMQFINAGMMPSASLLESAGIDGATAQSLVAAINAEQVSASEKPTLTAAQVNAAIKAGILTDAVLAAYEYYYGRPYRG